MKIRVFPARAGMNQKSADTATGVELVFPARAGMNR